MIDFKCGRNVHLYLEGSCALCLHTATLRTGMRRPLTHRAENDCIRCATDIASKWHCQACKRLQVMVYLLPMRGRLAVLLMKPDIRQTTLNCEQRQVVSLASACNLTFKGADRPNCKVRLCLHNNHHKLSYWFYCLYCYLLQPKHCHTCCYCCYIGYVLWLWKPT